MGPVVFAGDSITAAGGFVGLVAEGLGVTDVVNAGANGNTVSDLAARWSHDVLRWEPTMLVVAIGINDLHFTVVDGDGSGDTAGAAASFEGTYQSLVDQAVAASKPELVLVDPFFAAAEDDPDPYRQRMLAGIGHFTDAVRRVAERTGARHVALHEVFQRELRRVPAAELAPDAVHPTPRGCHLIAATLLQAVWRT